MTRIRLSYSLLSKTLTGSSFQRIFKRNIVTKMLKADDKSITVNVRHMVEEDIPQIKQLRRKYNFYDPLSLYSMCMEFDPTSIIVVDDGQGKVIGIAGNFKGIENLSVIGLLTIEEEYRKFGITGRAMIPLGLTLVKNRTLLAHVVEKQYLINSKIYPYLAKHFVNVEFEGEEVYPERQSSYVPQGVEIRKFDDSHLVNLLEYDHLASGYNREALAKFNCCDANSETVIALENGKCVGYGTIKLDIQGGKKVGPLYADNPEIAEALLKQLLESFKSVKRFHGNALGNNAPAMMMFEKLGKMITVVNYRICSEDITWPDYKNVYSVFELEIQPV